MEAIIVRGHSVGEVAIVTGASSGLGRALAERLAQQGIAVVGVSRRPDPDPIQGVESVLGSVADQQTVDESFAAADRLGDLRLLINCAGQGVFGDVGGYSVTDVTAALEGNLVGLIAFTDRAVAEMRDNGGDIVCVMSTAAKKLRPAESVYTAAKWGAKAYTRTVREALKASKSPIRMIEVYPCGMNTRFWSEAIRPVSDGSSFPAAGPIADDVLAALAKKADSYQQELTYERS